MPCNTITTVSSELKNVNRATLKAALVSLGYNVREASNNLYWQAGSYQDGKLTARNDNQIMQVKQAYGRETVKAQAKRFGWTVKQTSDNQFEITKR
jgi:hypothetical protein